MKEWKSCQKNVPGRQNENVLEYANSVLKEGVNLKVTQAECKPVFIESYPGVNIAKCASPEDKSTIMRKKSALRNKDQYKDIHIDSHKSFEQRKLDSNIRASVNSVGKD